MGLIVGPAICIGSTLQNNSSVSYFETEAEYIYRKSGGSDAISSGKATMSSIKGKSIVWNQLMQNGDFENGTTGFVIYKATASVSDKELTLTISSGNTSGSFYKDINVVLGHKYLIFLNAKKGSATRASLQTQKASSDTVYTTSGTYEKLSVIATATGNNAELRVMGWAAGEAGETASFRNMCVFDLTLMFGAGNEPTTVAEFEAMYPLPYYAYNAGEIVSNKATALETVGFNQWDEEVEDGSYNYYTGEKENSSSVIASYYRSANAIKVFPNTTYCFTKIAGQTCRVFEYDSAGNYLMYSSPATVNQFNLFTTGSNTHAIRFFVTRQNLDICINISDPAKNGTYQPYEKHTLTLNLPTLTGKLNGEGTSVTLCPNGLKSAGAAYDEGIVENGYLTKIVKRIGSVDMGTLSWLADHPSHRFYSTNFTSAKAPASNDEAANMKCGKYPTVTASQIFSATYGIALSSGNAISASDIGNESADAATFKTAVTGVKLIYELATPETYILDTPIPVKYRVYNGGTEERLPKDTSSSVSAPIKYTVLYPKPKNN